MKYQIEIDERQIEPLLKVLTENDPYLDYRELAALSITLSDLRDLKVYGEVRWRVEAEAAKKLREMEAEAPEPGKPVKSFKHKMYDYNEVIRYIENKYKIQTRGYKDEIPGPDGKREYRDFWHWMLDYNDVHSSGCEIGIPEDWRPEDGPWWVTEIIELIRQEFFPNYDFDDKDCDELMEFWCWW